MGKELLVMISDPVFSPFSSYQKGASNDSQGSVLLHPPHHVWQESSSLNFSWSVFPSKRKAQACPPSASPQARRAGQGKVHVIMPGDVIHVPALGEQSVNFTKIGIINNFGNSTLAYPHHLRDLLLGPAKAF